MSGAKPNKTESPQPSEPKNKAMETITPIWEKHKHIIALIVGLLGWFGFVAKLWLERTDGPNFVYDVNYGPFEVPNVDFSMWEMGSTTENEQLFQGFLTLSIRNNGNITAKEVGVLTAQDGYVAIQLANGDKRKETFQNKIPIGDIPIDETVSLSIWLENRINPDSTKIVVNHQTGSDEVPLPKLRLDPSRWIIIGVGILTGCMVIIVRRWSSRKSDDHLRKLEDNLKGITESVDKLSQQRTLLERENLAKAEVTKAFQCNVQSETLSLLNKVVEDYPGTDASLIALAFLMGLQAEYNPDKPHTTET